MKMLLVPLVIGAVALAGCSHLSKQDKGSPSTSKEGQQEEQGEITENPQARPNFAEQNLGGQEQAPSGQGVMFADYQNKAAGYSLQRPDKWYWQHYLKADLDLYVSQADDLLVVDPQPLQKLSSDWFGQMAVEVGRRDLAQHVNDWLKDFSVSDTTVGGTKATRYEGISLEKGGDMKVIEYHLMKGTQSVRLIYNKIGSTAADEQIFERLVQSFTWTRAQ